MSRSVTPRIGAAPRLPARFLAALLVMGTLLLAVVPAAHAVSIAVTTTDDELNGDGDCSLREAIEAANTDAMVDACAAGSGSDDIMVPTGIYTLTISGAKENSNASGDLDLGEDVTITGAGQGQTIIDGNAADRVLHVITGTVTVADLTIRNGRAPDGNPGANCIDQGECHESGGAGEDGGGIRTESGTALTLRVVKVADNQAGDGGDAGDVDCPEFQAECETFGGDGGYGGGIAGFGSLTIERSVLSGNAAGAGGAAGAVATGGCDGAGSCAGAGRAARAKRACGVEAVCSSSEGSPGDGGGVVITDDSLDMSTTTVEGNTSLDWAGGVYCHFNSMCTITSSTISGNTAGWIGGGLTLIEAEVTVLNTTISNNSVTGSGSPGGGGVGVYSGSIDLTFVTIAGNAVASGDGGGILVGDLVTMRNSILADNTDAGGQAPDCTGTIVTGGYNHIESLTGCVFVPGAGDSTGFDPGLTALGDNGGPTWTQAPGPISPVIDTIPAGTNGCGTTVLSDQRGAFRSTDGDANGTAACDKGAVELGLLQCGIQFASEPAVYTYSTGPDTVEINVVDDGSDLDCIRVTNIPYNHANATPVQMTGRYWIIDTETICGGSLAAPGTSSLDDCLRALNHQEPALAAADGPIPRVDAATPDYTVDLTLPYGAADPADTVCRYTGSGWDCAATSFLANTSVTRDAIHELSDWAVGNNPFAAPTPTPGASPTALAPTAARVLSFTAALDPSGRVVLAWETASEVDVAGFRVERAAGTGPWRAVSPLLPARGDGAAGARYGWADAPGVGTHAYRLVVVSAAGRPETFGSQSVVVKALRLFLPRVMGE